MGMSSIGGSGKVATNRPTLGTSLGFSLPEDEEVLHHEPLGACFDPLAQQASSSLSTKTAWKPAPRGLSIFDPLSAKNLELEEMLGDLNA
jgi:hypothetical protein